MLHLIICGLWMEVSWRRLVGGEQSAGTLGRAEYTAARKRKRHPPSIMSQRDKVKVVIGDDF